MKFFIGADHRGFALKKQLFAWLKDRLDNVIDCGAYQLDLADDYPDFAFNVAKAVAHQPDSLGLVICGSGIGVTIAANKVKGIRAACGCNLAEIKHGREADSLNVLTIGADYVNFSLAKRMIEVFLKSQPLVKERFQRRLRKIEDYESRT